MVTPSALYCQDARVPSRCHTFKRPEVGRSGFPAGKEARKKAAICHIFIYKGLFYGKRLVDSVAIPEFLLGELGASVST